MTGPNHDIGFGGAIFNSRILTVEQSTFIGNSSVNGRGGAIYNNGGVVTVTNSTFTNNSVTNSGAYEYIGLGGAIENDNGTLTVTNSTFSGNSAHPGGGGAIASRSWSAIEDTTTTVNKSIFTASTGNNCAAVVVPAEGTEPAGKPIIIVDGGANFSYGDTTCPGSNVDPLLSSLGDNGGSTQTFALQSGSPAIGAVAAGCPAIDQRGVTRTLPCDSGAFEYRVASNVTVTVTRTDSGETIPTYGYPVVFRAVTNPDTTTGKVTFYVDGMPIGLPITIVTGRADLSSSRIPAGVNHVITAAWEGSVTEERVTGTYAGNLTVNPAPLAINATSQTSTYGLADPTVFPATYAGFVNGETEAVLDTRPVCSASGTAPRNAGLYTITCVGATDNNYEITHNTGTLTINKATVSVTPNAKGTTYGAADPTFDFAYGAFQHSDTASVIDTAPTCGVSGAHQDAGTYTIACAGGLDNNYLFSFPSTALLTVSKATLTVTANAKETVYGGADPTFNFAYGAFQYTDDPDDLDTAPTCGVSGAHQDAGAYDIICSGGDDDNYDFTYTKATLTVSKAALTVTANAKEKFAGAADPIFDFAYGPFQYTDDAAAIDTAPTCGVSGAHDLSGTYDIICSGGADNNYAFTFENGTLTVRNNLLYLPVIMR